MLWCGRTQAMIPREGACVHECSWVCLTNNFASSDSTLFFRDYLWCQSVSKAAINFQNMTQDSLVHHWWIWFEINIIFLLEFKLKSTLTGNLRLSRHDISSIFHRERETPSKTRNSSETFKATDYLATSWWNNFSSWPEQNWPVVSVTFISEMLTKFLLPSLASSRGESSPLTSHKNSHHK